MVKRKDKIIAVVSPSVSKESLEDLIHSNITKGSTIFTDEFKSYRGLNDLYSHDYVNHSEENYAKTGLYGVVHTNTVEGFWSLLKRGIIGIYHYTSKKHLQRYLDAFCYRYNHRDYGIKGYFDNVIIRGEGKGIKYKDLIQKG